MFSNIISKFRARFLGGLTPWQLAAQSLRGFRQHGLDARGAQFAYYAMFAVVHLLIMLIAVLARLPVEGVLESFVQATGRTLPPTAADVILSQIEDIKGRGTTSLGILAVVVFIYSGSRLFVTISRGLNAAYGVRELRRGWQVQGLALVMTCVSFLLLLAALILLVLGPQLTEWLAEQVYLSSFEFFLYRATRWTIVCLAVLLATSMIYRLAPSVRQRWAPLSVGCLVATAGWVLISLGLRYYVVNFGRYNEIYGALGGVVVLMLWLYLTGIVLMLGGKVNAVIYHAQRERKRAGRV